MKTLIKCFNCGPKEVEHSDITNGVGHDKEGRDFCYDCCAKEDQRIMHETGRYTLYYTGGEVTNWPGNFRLPIYGLRKSWHNIGRERLDFWFNFEGFVWHGYQIGDWNQIAHVRRTKEVLR